MIEFSGREMFWGRVLWNRGIIIFGDLYETRTAYLVIASDVKSQSVFLYSADRKVIRDSKLKEKSSSTELLDCLYGRFLYSYRMEYSII